MCELIVFQGYISNRLCLANHRKTTKKVISDVFMTTWKYVTSAPALGLQAFFGHVGVGHLAHDGEGRDGWAQHGDVPRVPPDAGREPGGAGAQQQTRAAQQVSDESCGSVVALQLGQRPAFSQFVVDQRQCCHRLQHHHTHGDHAHQPVPRGEMRLTVQVLVVEDGSESDQGTGHAGTLQDPVQL